MDEKLLRLEDMKVGIIGAGLIGRKRAEVISAEKNDEIILICDIEIEKAQVLTGLCGGKPASDWRSVVDDPRIEAVIVATPNIFLKDISIAALENGKHVLCEKPLGRNAREAEAMWRAARRAGRILKTGFNHRHHPAVWKARSLVEEGELGELYLIRCIYGHGGRPGYEKEWRANREICGGGELLDQGVHVADLFRWFLGEFNEASGWTETFYWKMDVEDNAFAIFRTAEGRVAQMHTSWTQWRNRFSFEIFGEKGYLAVEGLGGSYGIEKLIIGKRKFDDQAEDLRTGKSLVYLGGVPDEKTLEFEGPDLSWQEEWKEFISSVRENRDPIGSGYDGLMANRMIEAVYKSARLNRPVKIQTG
jgi:predicted dehydrogenase